VDVSKLLDWSVYLSEENTRDGGTVSRNPEGGDFKENGAMVTVNGTDVAVFKYGEKLIATSEYCPHAGGSLHLGDIEMLPDKSLCVRCPVHRWTFCVSSPERSQGDPNSMDPKVGSCISPATQKDKKLKVFPVLQSQDRKHIKIGFE